MSDSAAIKGSFRDPSGHVFKKDGRVFRTITTVAADDFKAVEDTGLLQRLIAKGWLVDYSDVDDVRASLNDDSPASLNDDSVVRVLEHPTLPFISYPYEWSFASLKAAALLHLDIQIEAFAAGVVLSDATAFNIQFQGPKPVFIDHLSFRPYREGEYWTGHRQFCEQFLNPLLLRARMNIPHNAWYRGSPEGIPSAALTAMLPWRARLNPKLLTNLYLPVMFDAKVQASSDVSAKVEKRALPKNGYLGMLHSLRGLIDGLSAPNVSTVWRDYADNTSYASDEAQKKHAFVQDFVKASGATMVWDIGCNTGDYSKAALDAGAERVIGFEFDSGALELAHARAIAEGLDFQPLFLDAANPTPSQGWNECERDGMKARRPADGLLALAVTHHICIGRNVPMGEVVDWLVGHAPQGVIEFVPKNDAMVQQLLSLREDIFPDYSVETFAAELEKRAKIVKSEVVTESGRTLFHYDRS